MNKCGLSNRMNRVTFTLIVGSLILACNSGYGQTVATLTKTATEQTQIKEKEQRLRHLRHTIEQLLERERRLAEQEKSVSTEVDRIDLELELLNRDTQLLNLKREKKQAELARIKGEILQRSASLRDAEAKLGTRLRALYKRGDWSMLRLLAGNTSLAEFSHTMSALRYIARKDLSFITQYRHWISLLKEQQRLMKSTQSELASMEQRLHEARTLKVKKRKIKALFLERLRQEKNELELRKKNLAHDAEKLNKWFEKEITQRISGTFSSNKGRLHWPVRGKIMKKFGKIRDNRYFTFYYNRGITIASPEGTPVIAVARGVVKYADWFQGFGNVIIIAHADNYYTLYGHLQEIIVSVGDYVKELSVIGRVGQSASDAGSVLYFELRKKGKAINPVPWLKP